MDIETIAVGHGSVINENTHKIISKTVNAKLKKSEGESSGQESSVENSLCKLFLSFSTYM